MLKGRARSTEMGWMKLLNCEPRTMYETRMPRARAKSRLENDSRKVWAEPENTM